MPALVIDADPGAFGEPGQHPAGRIAAETGDGYTFRYAPVEVSVSGDGSAWAVTDRPGRLPLLQRSGRQLREVTFTIIIADPDNQIDVEADIKTLWKMYRRGGRVRLDLGDGGADAGGGRWHRMTSLARKSVARQYGSNKITAAEVEVTLTEANDVDAVARVGPVGGGADFAGRITAYRAKYRDGKPRTYTTRPGDSLHSVAIDFYGNATFWRQIADASGITDPRRLTAGMVLRIP